MKNWTLWTLECCLHNKFRLLLLFPPHFNKSQNKTQTHIFPVCRPLAIIFAAAVVVVVVLFLSICSLWKFLYLSIFFPYRMSYTYLWFLADTPDAVAAVIQSVTAKSLINRNAKPSKLTHTFASLAQTGELPKRWFSTSSYLKMLIF